jgi:hypothetical protein
MVPNGPYATVFSSLESPGVSPMVTNNSQFIGQEMDAQGGVMSDFKLADYKTKNLSFILYPRSEAMPKLR